MKLNDEGVQKSSMALVGLVAVLAVVLLVTSGLIAIQLPTATDKYSEYVNRHATDIGIKIPIDVKLTFNQVTDTGSNRANVDVTIKHKHDSGNDYVPDATLISSSNFNTQVANVDDTKTRYAVNGNEFLCANVTWNSTIKSVANVEFGYAQDNYKVWGGASTHTPGLTKNNHVVVVQAQIDRLVKGTDTILNSHVITWGIYYYMPAYNEEWDYTASYTYYLFIPFDDYALTQDLRATIRGYYDSCVIQWKEITTTSRSYWSIEMFGITLFKVVKQKDNTVTTNLIYDWQNPLAYSVDNGNQYGSHRYTYKVR